MAVQFPFRLVLHVGNLDFDRDRTLEETKITSLTGKEAPDYDKRAADKSFIDTEWQRNDSLPKLAAYLDFSVYTYKRFPPTLGKSLHCYQNKTFRLLPPALPFTEHHTHPQHYRASV